VNLLEFNLQHVIALLKHLQNVDLIQPSLQLLAERLQLNNVNKDVHQDLLNQFNQLDQDQLEQHQHHTKELQFNHQPAIVLHQLFHNVDHHQQMDQLHVEHKFT
jgi:exopolyphosphatase/pppGpp-phosphohydrolase